MKNIRWLVLLANRKPLAFSLALLLIAISILGTVVKYQETKYVKCSEELIAIEKRYGRRLDSINNYYRKRESDLNDELRDYLNFVIKDYQRQLQEQKENNSKTIKAIIENEKIIYKTKNR